MLLSLGGRSIVQCPCRCGWLAGTLRRLIRALGGRVGCRRDTPREPRKPTTSHDDTTRARREQDDRTATVACGRDVKTARPPESRTAISETRHPEGKHLVPSWYRSSSLSSSSERTPESRRRGCGRDVEKRRDARSLRATRETPGRLIPQAEPQAELQPEVSRNSILALGRRTCWPGRHSEWGAASPPGGFVAGDSISAFYLPSDKESTSGHHLKASAFIAAPDLKTPARTPASPWRTAAPCRRKIWLV
jgi:hypothetical protein